MSTSKRKQIVILGSGFGGLYAVLQLEKTLARDSDIEVTLVKKGGYHESVL